MSKPAYIFLNHTFTSSISAGQKVSQTCPSLTKLLPILHILGDCCTDSLFHYFFSWIEINWHLPPPPPFWQVQNALRAPTIERCASSAASPVSSGCLSPQKLRGKWSLRPGTHPVTTLPTEDLKMLTGVSRKFFPQE